MDLASSTQNEYGATLLPPTDILTHFTSSDRAGKPFILEKITLNCLHKHLKCKMKTNTVTD